MMNRRTRILSLDHLFFVIVMIFSLVSQGCQALVDFDRSKIADAGRDVDRADTVNMDADDMDSGNMDIGGLDTGDMDTGGMDAGNADADSGGNDTGADAGDDT